MEIEWFCDECDAELNRQSGFNTDSGLWTCTKCGCVNSVTPNDILYGKKAEIARNLQASCPKCKGHMRYTDEYGAEFVCEDCGYEAAFNEIY